MATTTKATPDEATVEAANAANAADAAAAVTEATTTAKTGDLLVLVSAFNARTSATNKRLTKRYRRGETFVPIDGLHDVDDLIERKVIGRAGDGPLKPSTGLVLSQAAASFNDEDSPVIDLASVPFTQPNPDADGSPADVEPATA